MTPTEEYTIKMIQYRIKGENCSYIFRVVARPINAKTAEFFTLILTQPIDLVIEIETGLPVLANSACFNVTEYGWVT